MAFNLLYGEDDSNWANFTRDLLEDYGFHVMLACDGDDVWEKYLVCKPDILLLDLEMPGMDVLKLIEKIKQFKDNVPIAIYSVHVDSEKSVSVVRLGVDAYFDKGCNTTLFVEQLKSIILRNQQRQLESHVFALSSCSVYNHLSATLTIQGEEICLKKLDSLLLRFLAIRINQWVDREYLIRGMWGDDMGKELKKYVTHLRKLLLADENVIIENRSGGWYRLRNLETKHLS